MAPSKLRKAIGAVKDKASIGLAKVNNSSDSLSDIDVTIVRATRHEEHPPEERYIREILSLTSYSRSNVNACVSTISKRLGKTKNWVVALKTLMLIHRLITNGDQSYEEEIFFSSRRGIRLLNMSDFRDTSSSNSWHYSAFVRTYAMYLDEYLDFRMHNRQKKNGVHAYEVEVEDEEGDEQVGTNATHLHEKEFEQILTKARLLMSLLERFLACKPTGVAKTNRVVIVALCPVVKESFHLYEDITEIICLLIERFMELDVPNSEKVHAIFCHASKQHEELITFYGWCKKIGIAHPSEYPDVEKISQKKLDTMEDYIREKSRMAKNRKVNTPLKLEDKKLITELSPSQKRSPAKSKPETEEEDTKKLIIVPIGFQEDKQQQEEEKEENQNKTQENADLLNLGEDSPTKADDLGDKLALALFDDYLANPASTTSTNSSSWVAFNDSAGSWETTSSMQTVRHLSNQQSAAGGHFNQRMLDLMYQQGATQYALTSSGLVTTTGSASSVAFRDTRKPGLLALPAPNNVGEDPFAASLSVAPPIYVQKSELEKRQRLLLQEQIMWQQYAREGMRGEIRETMVHQHYLHQTGAYTHTY